MADGLMAGCRLETLFIPTISLKMYASGYLMRTKYLQMYWIQIVNKKTVGGLTPFLSRLDTTVCFIMIYKKVRAYYLG